MSQRLPHTSRSFHTPSVKISLSSNKAGICLAFPCEKTSVGGGGLQGEGRGAVRDCEAVQSIPISVRQAGPLLAASLCLSPSESEWGQLPLQVCDCKLAAAAAAAAVVGSCLTPELCL